MSEVALSLILTGKRKMTADELEQLCAILCVPPDAFVKPEEVKLSAWSFLMMNTIRDLVVRKFSGAEEGMPPLYRKGRTFRCVNREALPEQTKRRAFRPRCLWVSATMLVTMIPRRTFIYVYSGQLRRIYSTGSCRTRRRSTSILLRRMGRLTDWYLRKKRPFPWKYENGRRGIPAEVRRGGGGQLFGRCIGENQTKRRFVCNTSCFKPHSFLISYDSSFGFSTEITVRHSSRIAHLN